MVKPGFATHLRFEYRQELQLKYGSGIPLIPGPAVRIRGLVSLIVTGEIRSPFYQATHFT